MAEDEVDAVQSQPVYALPEAGHGCVVAQVVDLAERQAPARRVGGGRILAGDELTAGLGRQNKTVARHTPENAAAPVLGQPTAILRGRIDIADAGLVGMAAGARSVGLAHRGPVVADLQPAEAEGRDREPSIANRPPRQRCRVVANFQFVHCHRHPPL